MDQNNPVNQAPSQNNQSGLSNQRPPQNFPNPQEVVESPASNPTSQTIPAVTPVVQRDVQSGPVGGGLDKIQKLGVTLLILVLIFAAVSLLFERIGNFSFSPASLWPPSK